MKKFWLITTVIFLTACSRPPEEKAEGGELLSDEIVLTKEQAANAGITTGAAEQKSMSSYLRVNGFIDVPPQNKVSISVPLGGYLKETSLLPGMHVNKGEVIALMEDQQYIQLQQDFLTAKTKLVLYEAEYNRQKDLNQSKAASDKAFQQAQSDFITQKVLVKSLAEKLKLININPENLSDANLSRSVHIYSPITGYVSKVNVNIGKYTRPEDVLFEIVNPEDIHLVLYVFEKDVDRLAIGQKVTVYTNNAPEKKYECEIILIGKDFSQDRSVEVHCHFKNYDKSLIPGMFMNGEIELKNTQAWVLPSDAVVSNANKNYVFIPENGKFKMKEVITGTSENGLTQISFAGNESPAGKTFVIKGAYSLLMKARNTAD